MAKAAGGLRNIDRLPAAARRQIAGAFAQNRRAEAREMAGNERFVATLGRLGVTKIRLLSDAETMSGTLNKGPVYRIRYNRRTTAWTANGRTGGMIIHEQGLGMRTLSRWIRS